MKWLSSRTGLIAPKIQVSVVAIMTAASAAHAAEGQCISEQAKQALAACPAVSPKEFKGGKSTGVGFRGVAPVGDPNKKKDNKPGKPDFEQGAAQRDERTSRLKARQRGLLVTEIQGIESLFSTTPKNAADRPQLARRLAEAYVELEAAAFRDKTQAEMDRDALKKSNPTAAGQKQTQVQQADSILKNSRKKAVQYYTLVVNDYPNYPALDEVLYYLAYEYEQANDYKNARRVYYDLINKRPNSKYIPNAYLAFGELFFNEAQGDPSKWDLAEQAYKEVIKFPPEKGNKVYGYAWYKLGYVYWNKGDAPQGLNAFKRTIEYGTQYTQLPGAGKLAETARRDIVPVYAMQGNPLAAFNFFKPLSGDAGSSNTKTFQMMDDLGLNYIDTGHYPEAVTLYEDLIKRDKGDKSCVYQVHITEASMAMKSGNKDFIRGKLDDQIKAHNAFMAAAHDDKAKFECANKTAALTTETAMAWHLEAAGSQGQRGTGDQKTMTAAAQLYKSVVDTWQAKEFSQFEFPRLIKEDWPTIYKIKYNMADLLYFQEKWAECGPAFDAVVEENPTGPDAAEAAFASVLCYQKIYEAGHSKENERQTLKARAASAAKKQDETKNAKDEMAAKLAPKEFTPNQKGMIQAFNRYVCYVKPGANDENAKTQLAEVKYARARTYLEAFHWEEAALGFRDVGVNYSDKEVGLLGAQYYLEAVNVLGEYSKPPRPGCFDDMATEVPKFIELYCTGTKAQANKDDCDRLNKIQADILAKKGEKLVELADSQSGTEALLNYEKGADAYMEVFKTYCEAPVAAKQAPTSEKCDKVSYNAARAYQAARLIAKAIQARTSLINFDNQTKGNSPLAKKAIYEIGGNYQAIAVYDKAAAYFEQFQAADPKAENADTALADAVVLRLGLGNEEEAIKDADKFRKSYGASKPAQTAAIAYAVGAHYADKEDWDRARSTLKGAIGVINKAAPDIQVQAHATLGRSLSKLKNGDREAAAEFAKVRGLWSNPDDAVAKIKSAYPTEDDAAIQRRVGKALTAVGEAYFYSAEQIRREKVETVKFPAYSGPGSKETVLKHINTKVKDWLEKKRDAISKAEVEYKKIVDLKPDAPPRWVIAAGSRVGLMWGGFVDEFRAAPIPAEWKRDPELRGTYYDALDGASEPIKSGKAKPALVTCLSYSVKFQYFDDYSRNCEVWLAKNYKAEYHVVDELRGSPTLANNALDERTPPLLLGGQFFREQTGGPDKPAGQAATDANQDTGKKKK